MIYLVSNNGYLFDLNEFELISIEKSIEILSNLEELSLDTETEGLDCFTDKILLLQIGNYDVQVLYDINSFNGNIPKLLKDFINNNKGLFILQNAKFDLKFLFLQDVIITKVFDTMLAEIILTHGLQTSGRSLDNLALKYCNVYLDKSVRGEIIKQGLSNRVLKYGADDIKYLTQIKNAQLELIKEKNLQTALNLDNSFVVALAYTEFCGIKLDFTKWVAKTQKNQMKVKELQIKLEDQLLKDKKMKFFSGMHDMFTGAPDCIINWDSPKQVIELFNSYGINTVLQNKGTSKASIDAKVLKPQENDFPIIPLYLNYKEAAKEVSTYGLGWRKFINPKTGRIHTNFTQIINTGRLSSSPNIQNLPSDNETRECFICEEGNCLIDADYNSQEQIVLANFSREPNLLNFYAKGFKDMHSYIAFLMYPAIRRCSLEELTPEKLLYIKSDYADLRYLAKIAGFSIKMPFIK